MENLIIKKTDTTPYVNIDCDKGTITIEGICIPENPHEFFEPIRKKIDCIKKTNSEILFDIYLEYFNTAASKNLLELFLTVSNKEDSEISSKVIWRIEDEEDEEAIEQGEIFQDITKIPFEIVAVN